MPQLQDICSVWIRIIWSIFRNQEHSLKKKRILCSNFISSSLHIKWNTLFFPPILDHWFKAAVFFSFFVFLLFLSFSVYTKVIRMKGSDDYFYTLKITVTFSVLCYLRKLLGQVVLIFIYNLKNYYKISFIERILF